jgi:hypothetical protein
MGPLPAQKYLRCTRRRDNGPVPPTLAWRARAANRRARRHQRPAHGQQVRPLRRQKQRAPVVPLDRRFLFTTARTADGTGLAKATNLALSNIDATAIAARRRTRPAPRRNQPRTW